MFISKFCLTAYQSPEESIKYIFVYQFLLLFNFPRKNNYCCTALNHIIEKYQILLQILSGDFLKSYGRDIINIHHGLLPSFKGGNPSKQVNVNIFSLGYFYCYV